jgi:uncharacterized protein
MEKQYCLEVRESSIDRRGCFAGEPIPAGAVFAEYVGERITREEALRREADPQRPAIYTLWLDSGAVIDGLFGGNETKYLNHSCAPNVLMEETVGRLFFVAARDIAAGEELTIDYAYEPVPPLEPCRCGAPTCRGYINDESAVNLR